MPAEMPKLARSASTQTSCVMTTVPGELFNGACSHVASRSAGGNRPPWRQNARRQAVVKPLLCHRIPSCGGNQGVIGPQIQGANQIQAVIDRN